MSQEVFNTFVLANLNLLKKSHNTLHEQKRREWEEMECVRERETEGGYGVTVSEVGKMHKHHS